MSFSHRHVWTGTRLTVGDLRTLAAWTEGMSTGDPVEVRVAPRFNNPTDPGGEITIEITADERFR